MEKIGLIAGNRRFPILLAESAQKKGFSVIAVGLKGDTSPSLKQFTDKLFWIGLGEFSLLFNIFKGEGIDKIIMAGQISPRRLFSKEIEKDAELRKLLRQVQDKKADTIFSAIADKLTQSGFSVLDSTTFIEHLLPGKGVLTQTQPGFNEWEDIYFGFDLARRVAELDIGQTVAVKNKAIVAVEALEGTDNLIRRAGRIARGAIAVVKVSRPKQDMRFDIPVIGPTTVKNLLKVKASCLAIEAKKTLFIDRELSVQLADKRGLCVVAV